MYERSWQRFFEVEAPTYLDNVFTKNTEFEVAFLYEELGLCEGDRLLDVGCGTGRHAVRLAESGIKVTGIDLSREMLAIARETARKAGVDVELVQGDAASTRLDAVFDHAICLCEGAFCLLEPAEKSIQYHRRILENVASMLRTDGIFLLTVLNGYRLARSYTDDDVRSGRFDPLELAEIEEHRGSDGAAFRTKEKGFTPSELSLLLQSTGFRVCSIWGGTAGSWNRAPLRLDEIEMMVTARRV